MQEPFDNAADWFKSLDWEILPYQLKAWNAHKNGKHLLINAPTGTGKTFAALLGALDKSKTSKKKRKGVQIIWIAPIRALAKEINHACVKATEALGLQWKIAVRNGDTSTAERQKQKKYPPHILITTPESLHLLLAQKGYVEYFKNLKLIVADEWHEMLGSKRAVQVELALSRLKSISAAQITGVSATIGNFEEAINVLFGNNINRDDIVFIKSKIKKDYEVIPVYPDEIETYPWSGHLGLKLIDKIVPIIENSRSTLIFTNTRSQCEIWYHHLISKYPDFAGIVAMHHGSIDREMREWVEQALHENKLKAVVCTSSLDLGVDFRPVETIIQIGGPKGVARFFQRAGRSGHRPGEVSKIYFLPTHALELLESAALRQAIKENKIEARTPYIRSFDVLVQYLITLSISEGFYPEIIYEEVKTTFSFSSISRDEWNWCISFITKGGKSLYAYDEFKKVVPVEKGILKIANRKAAMRHRLNIGTIVSDPMLLVKYVRGPSLGHIEESFISRMSVGDVFWFAGNSLEIVRIKDMTVQVKKSARQKGRIPAWKGGRLPLSSQLADVLREKIEMGKQNNPIDEEVRTIKPIFVEQSLHSHVPSKNEFLIEKIKTQDGYHLFFYSIEGRFVHEGLSSLFSWRIAQLKDMNFSLAFNDYGFELLSDVPIPLEKAIQKGLFSLDNLFEHIQASVNANEMARRRFRDIAGISGLVFKGFPGKYQKEKHLQSSSQLFFEVFKDYEPENLLYRQAYSEALEFQLEEVRLREALERINRQTLVITEPQDPTPFCFPILVDRLREKMTFESLESQIKKMTV